jgi:hypothetical protein
VTCGCHELLTKPLAASQDDGDREDERSLDHGANSPPPATGAGAGSTEALDALGLNSAAPSGAGAGISVLPLMSTEVCGLGRSRRALSRRELVGGVGVAAGVATTVGVGDGGVGEAAGRFAWTIGARFGSGRSSNTATTPAQTPAVTAVALHKMAVTLISPAVPPPPNSVQIPAPVAAVPAPAAASVPDRSHTEAIRVVHRSTTPTTGTKGRTSSAR